MHILVPMNRHPLHDGGCYGPLCQGMADGVTDALDHRSVHPGGLPTDIG